LNGKHVRNGPWIEKKSRSNRRRLPLGRVMI
jgi:hypothetical protein